MSDFQTGMLVQHVSLGVGKVVATEASAVHVFFPGGEDRFARKLRLPMALSMLSPAGGDGSAWLAGLSAFALDAKTGRYGLAEKWFSSEQAIARFLETFEQGFADPKYIGDGKAGRERSTRWRHAHEAFVAAFGRGEGERLLAIGDGDELVRRALGVERHVRTLQNAPEKPSLEDALKEPTGARGYFAAMFDLLSAPAPERSRFEALASAVAALPPGGARESGWALITVLPFIARPDSHMLLRPRFTCEAAQCLGLDLRYDPKPSWATYAALLQSTDQLLDSLRPLGARDYIDVESFMHVVTTRRSAHPKASDRLVT
jgi:hypothetical protein